MLTLNVYLSFYSTSDSAFVALSNGVLRVGKISQPAGGLRICVINDVNDSCLCLRQACAMLYNISVTFDNKTR